ncbi:hypothetical protein DFH06DRAFT_1123500 [Mycena polygramma]|nr:hypothetical protein DFH06DRAFT_1123500 [Mycena polygramma]
MPDARSAPVLQLAQCALCSKLLESTYSGLPTVCISCDTICSNAVRQRLEELASGATAELNALGLILGNNPVESQRRPDLNHQNSVASGSNTYTNPRGSNSGTFQINSGWRRAYSYKNPDTPQTQTTTQEPAPEPAPLRRRKYAWLTTATEPPAERPPPAPVPPRKRKRGRPKRVAVPLPVSAFPPGTYQSLELLLTELNRLLCTPHADRPVHFWGTCADTEVSEAAAADPAEHVREVAWEVINRTVLAFNVDNILIQTSGDSTFTMTESAAIWMGAGDDTSQNHPCARCEHNLTIRVVALEQLNTSAQSVVVALSHVTQ